MKRGSISVPASVGIGILCGAFGFAAGSAAFSIEHVDATISLNSEGAGQGEVWQGMSHSLSARDIARLACAPHSELQNFEQIRAVATTATYRFDCTQPGKVTQ